MSSETVSLLPCPFCGGVAYAHPKPVNGFPRVMCESCLGRNSASTIEAAIAAWNLRSKPVASGVEVRPLIWEAPDHTAWLGHGIEPCEYYIRFDGEEWVMPGEFQHEDAISYLSLEKAKAAAEADYRNRIMSALLPKATAPVVSEPVERADVVRAYDLLNSGAPYSARECKVSYALHRALFPTASEAAMKEA